MYLTYFSTTTNSYVVCYNISTGLLDLMKVGHIKPLTLDHIRTLFEQLLSALDFLHSRNIIHRDIKCSNLLITRNGVLKLADFGLALQIDPKSTRQSLHCKVITLWYRPPELFLGTPKYHSEVDMWSAGCILAEMLCCRPLFAKKTEREMLPRIFRVCGTPTVSDWPEHESLEHWDSSLVSKPREECIQKEIYAQASAFKPDRLFLHNQVTHPAKELQKAFALLRDLLKLNPKKRISAREALVYDFVQKCIHPAHLPPIIPENCPEKSKFGFHEMQTKPIRRKSREQQQQQQQKAAISVGATKSSSRASTSYKRSTSSSSGYNRSTSYRKRKRF